MLLVSEALGSLLVGEEHRYVIVGEARRLNWSAIMIAWDSLFAMPNTAFFATLYSFRSTRLLTFDFELIVDVARASDGLGFARDCGLFFFTIDRTA